MIRGLPALEMARVRVLGADQKKSGLLGQDCYVPHVYRKREDPGNWRCCGNSAKYLLG